MVAIDRRHVLAGLAGTAASSALTCRARAQSDRVRRIGVLVSGAEGDPEMQARLAGFRQGLGRLGWRDGQNIQIDYRYGTASAARMKVLAKELVATRPDLLVGMATTPAVTLHRETREIPIVMIGIADPIEQNLIASLAHPGGNVTGLLLYEESIAGKWLAMLKEMAPNLTRVAFLTNPNVSPSIYRDAAVKYANTLAIELVTAPFETAADIVAELENLRNEAERRVAGTARSSRRPASRPHHRSGGASASARCLSGQFLGRRWRADVLRQQPCGRAPAGGLFRRPHPAW